MTDSNNHQVRVYSKTVAYEAYCDPNNYDAMKRLSSDEVDKVIKAFISKCVDHLKNGTSVSIEGLGIIKIKLPNSKTRRCLDIHTGEMTEHRIYPKVIIKPHFSVSDLDLISEDEE